MVVLYSQNDSKIIEEKIGDIIIEAEKIKTAYRSTLGKFLGTVKRFPGHTDIVLLRLCRVPNGVRMRPSGTSAITASKLVRTAPIESSGLLGLEEFGAR